MYTLEQFCIWSDAESASGQGLHSLSWRINATAAVKRLTGSMRNNIVYWRNVASYLDQSCLTFGQGFFSEDWGSVLESDKKVYMRIVGFIVKMYTIQSTCFKLSSVLIAYVTSCYTIIYSIFFHLLFRVCTL